MRKKTFAAYLICAIACVLSVTCVAQRISRYRQEFIRSILSDAERANLTIKAQRARVNSLHHEYITRQTLSRYNIVWVRKISDYYGIKNFKLANQSLWRKLLRRVDVIPRSLVVAQAAYESDWGRSRFAKQGLNYFGQRCTVVGCGIIPKDRKSYERYEVKKFPDVYSSIKSYIYNLNTHSAYAHLRKVREQQRAAHHKLQGAVLAQGLSRYSERGGHYIVAIRKIIKYYGLWKYDVD